MKPADGAGGRPLRRRCLLAHFAAAVLAGGLVGPPLAGPRAAPSQGPPNQGMASPVAGPVGAESGEDAILLEERLDIEIRTLTSARVRFLNRTKVLTPRGVERYDTASLFYRPGVAIRRLEGAVILPTGKRVEVRKPQIFDGAAFASYELYSDSRHRSISFPGVVPGSTVEHAYELELKSLVHLPDQFYLQDGIPARFKSLTVRVPATVPIRLVVRGGAPDYRREESPDAVVHRWEVRDVPPLRREKGMPPVEDLLPRVLIAPGEILWETHRIDATRWDGVARFYRDLARERTEPTPEVLQKARELTEGVQDPLQKVRRVYEFVQGKVNYVAISLGVGGWQPHPAADVLRVLYGDCKDKATLMISMLRALDLEGIPVLIRTRDLGRIDPDLPALAFNHAVVAIQRPDGHLFLDPTSEHAPFGDLPWTDQGAWALVVRDDGRGEIVETPVLPPERNRQHAAIEGTVTPADAFEGSCVVEAWGQRRAELASLLLAKPGDRTQALQKWLSEVVPGAQLRSHEIAVPASPGDPLRMVMGLTIPRFVTRAGALLVFSPHLGRFPALMGLAGYPQRRHPVFFPYLSSDTLEHRVTLPAGRALRRVPQDRLLDGPGLKSESRFELARGDGRDVLVVRRSLTLSRREIPPPDYPALRGFLQSLAEEEASALTLNPE